MTSFILKMAASITEKNVGNEKDKISKFYDASRHPRFQAILNDENIDEEQIYLSMQVYLDLCEVRHWSNVTIHSFGEKKMAFLSGQPSKHEEFDVVLPLSVNTDLNVENIEKWFQEIVLENEGYTSDGITLALVASGSTTVYYKMTPGLVAPPPPEVVQQKKAKIYQRIENRRMTRNNALSHYEENADYFLNLPNAPVTEVSDQIEASTSGTRPETASEHEQSERTESPLNPESVERSERTELQMNPETVEDYQFIRNEPGRNIQYDDES